MGSIVRCGSGLGNLPGLASSGRDGVDAGSERFGVVDVVVLRPVAPVECRVRDDDRTAAPQQDFFQL